MINDWSPFAEDRSPGCGGTVAGGCAFYQEYINCCFFGNGLKFLFFIF
jgi:hypothetical protein